MGYTKISIKDSLNLITTGKALLPEIQRGFVWGEKDIIELYKSLILDYPIGVFLFWKAPCKTLNTNKLIMYKFVKDYHERDTKDNDLAESIYTSYDEYYIVLDGQQRMSSLYISLLGSLSLKTKFKKRDKDYSYPQKELYININSNISNRNDDTEEWFKFLTNEEAKSDDKWILLKDVYRCMDKNDIKTLCQTKNIDSNGQKILEKLFKIFNDKSIINYYEIQSMDYDDVLNIFVRVNSTGKKLTKINLVFSKITSKWPGFRKELKTLIDNINTRKKGNIFRFEEDFVTRCFLNLIDAPINFKIESFKDDNIKSIIDNWQKIKQTILKLPVFLENCGFSDNTITSYNALMPIAYYLYKGGELKNNEKEFKKYFIVSQLKNIFGTASNSVITETRKVLKDLDCKKTDFTLSLFDNIELTGSTNFMIDEAVIDKCFEYDKGPYAFMVLSLLYSDLDLNNSEWHQDHLHPYIRFENKYIKEYETDKIKVNRWRENRNKLPNLQLLLGPENEEKNKTPLTDWINKNPIKNTPKFLPEVDLSITNFDEFMKKRKELMKLELMKLFEKKAD